MRWWKVSRVVRKRLDNGMEIRSLDTLGLFEKSPYLALNSSSLALQSLRSAIGFLAINIAVLVPCMWQPIDRYDQPANTDPVFVTTLKLSN
ncbi:hypothetical protein TNCV_2520601 [Trichonephila clavipes]|nr:hypothetical protein TNCV_2520601 [Trichonephila clavipes]